MKKGEQTRRDIIERALELATQVGLENLSLGTLAESLELSKSGLFAHFASKERLQLDVVQEAIDQFGRTVVMPALTKPRGAPRFKALFDAYLQWARGQNERHRGCIFMALSQEYDNRPGPVRELLVESQETWRNTISRVVQAGVDDGAFSTAQLSPAQCAFEFIGIGMVFKQSARLLGDPRAEAMARAAFQALLKRLTPPKQP